MKKFILVLLFVAVPLNAFVGEDTIFDKIDKDSALQKKITDLAENRWSPYFSSDEFNADRDECKPLLLGIQWGGQEGWIKRTIFGDFSDTAVLVLGFDSACSTHVQEINVYCRLYSSEKQDAISFNNCITESMSFPHYKSHKVNLKDLILLNVSNNPSDNFEMLNSELVN